MALNIQHNMQALNASRNMAINEAQNEKAVEKLSTGFRINRAADDASGLAISETIRSQIKGLNRASRNAQDGVSLIQTADGAMETTADILKRMKTMAVQAATDTNTSADRANLQMELEQLTDEINRIADTVEYNTMKLLDGNFKNKRFHIGANSGQTISITIDNMDAPSLGLKNTDYLKIDTRSSANKTMEVINSALSTVSAVRSLLGAKQNSLEYATTNLDVIAENLQAAESRLRDTDMPMEVIHETHYRILRQSAQSMLALATQQPDSLIKLLDGTPADAGDSAAKAD